MGNLFFILLFFCVMRILFIYFSHLVLSPNIYTLLYVHPSKGGIAFFLFSRENPLTLLSAPLLSSTYFWLEALFSERRKGRAISKDLSR